MCFQTEGRQEDKRINSDLVTIIYNTCVATAMQTDLLNTAAYNILIKIIHSESISESRTERDKLLRRPTLKTGHGPTLKTGHGPTLKTGHGPTLKTGHGPTLKTGHGPTLKTGHGPTLKTGHGPTLKTGHGPTLKTGHGPTLKTVDGPTSTLTYASRRGDVPLRRDGGGLQLGDAVYQRDARWGQLEAGVALKLTRGVVEERLVAGRPVTVGLVGGCRTGQFWSTEPLL